MRQVARSGAREADRGLGRGLDQGQREIFTALYCDHFDFVFRNLRRLGVPSALTDDAVQEVYLVVLRHIDKYQRGSHPKAWLFAIAHRVASTYRRGLRRRRELAVVDSDEFTSADAGPFERSARSEAQRLLHGFLDSISDAQRNVFIMAELEQMTAPEIAHALDANVNTVYARLRAARREFTRMLKARRAAERRDG